MSVSMEIRFDDPRHQKILQAILRRRDYSKEYMDRRKEKWDRDEKQFLAYLPERDVDALRRVERDQGGKPQYTTIQVPYAYATLMSAATYWSTVFLSRDPVFQFTGRHGEPESARNAVEAIMEYQRQVGEMTTKLFVWLLDAGKRGIGFVSPYWCDEKSTVSVLEEVPEMYLGLPVEGKTRKVRRIMEVPGYQGNRLLNLRPQSTYPDPRKPFIRIQEGEFFGWDTKVSWNAIVKGWQEGEYFNLDQLYNIKRGSSGTREQVGNMVQDEPAQESWSSLDPHLDLKTFTVLEMVIELSPRDWGLGTTTSPEKWKFCVAEDQVIFFAAPLGEYHNKLPVAAIEYEVDGYALHNRSMIEVIKPLEDTVSWLINTHFYNVRKTLNDQFIVDPSRVMMKDLREPNPGKLIRLRPSAYGTDTKTVMTQLPVIDVTQQHLRDLMTVIDFGQRAVGVNDNIMGNLDPRGRKTATEARIAGTSGINRMKYIAEYMSAMGWGPLASMMLQSTQQHYDAEKQFRIAGDAIPAQQIQQGAFLRVTPEDIQGFFDFIPVDGTAPVDRFAIASLWRDLFREGSANPLVAQQYNMPDIFGWIAQLAGLKNISRFRIQLVPDQMAMQGAQAGNLIPIGGPNGAASVVGGGAGGAVARRPTRVGPTDSAGNARPTQVAGMGPAA